MPRFAILAHDFPTPHWDLFLEAGSFLRSWRLPILIDIETTFVAEPMPNHRLLYLDYEGPVSGGRGSVARVDAGTFAWELDQPDHAEVQLLGKVFVGRLILMKTVEQWLGRFEPDRHREANRGIGAGA